MKDSYWHEAIIAYIILAILTFSPVLYAMLQKVKLKTGEESVPWWCFKRRKHQKNNLNNSKEPFDALKGVGKFTQEHIRRLNENFERIRGAREFWKNQAEWHKRFHYYTIYWTVPISVVIPIMTQLTDNDPARHFLTIISTHVAVLYGLHRALKVESNIKAFRLGESEFYDTFRRMLDRPETFGSNPDQQLSNYFARVEEIRKLIRSAETDNFPSVDDTKGHSNSS